MSKLKLISRSARLYLWPAVICNAVVTSLVTKASAMDSALVGSTLACLASFGFILNDLLDRNVDRLNSASRLENADTSSMETASFAAALFLLVGLSIALLVTDKFFLVSAAITLGLILYSAIIRRILLAATLLSASLNTTPLWVPAIIWPSDSISLIFALTLGTYLLFMAREIILDIKDNFGDRIAGRQTFATVYGSRIAGFVASSISIAAGFVFFTLALRSTFASPMLQSYSLWLMFGLMLFMVVVPGLRVAFFSPGANELMSSYITRSRVAMVALPLVLGLILLAD